MFAIQLTKKGTYHRLSLIIVYMIKDGIPRKHEIIMGSDWELNEKYPHCQIVERLKVEAKEWNEQRELQIYVKAGV